MWLLNVLEPWASKKVSQMSNLDALEESLSKASSKVVLLKML